MIRAALVAGLAVALSACGAATGESGTEGRDGQTGGSRSPETIALHTSLPIVWRESGAISDLLGSEREPHWVLAALQRRANVVPLDTLAGERGLEAIPNQSLLVLAQPRALSPDDNVALDDWVRAGGRVLLFADPMLTQHSAFALGDPRRPQDVALLSPILARWGLELLFDEGQEGGKMAEIWRGQAIPFRIRGIWKALREECMIEADALLARCKVGKGSVLAVADAALIEESATAADSDEAEALDLLLNAALSQ